MPPPEPALPETRERPCPSCASERMIQPVSHVAASEGMIKVEYRCEACGTTFFVVRKAIV